MKKILGMVAIGVLLAAAYAAGRWNTSRRVEANGGARRVLYWVDPMHPSYRSAHPGIAPDCGMKLEPVYADTVASTLASASAAPGTVNIDDDRRQLFGIRLASVEKTSGAGNIRVLGRVVPEDKRVYRVDAGMDGFIRETFDDSLGTLVKKDQKLATYYGPDALSVASGFLAATTGIPGAAGKDGNRTIPYPGAVSRQGVSSVQGYADRLRNLGMSDYQIKQIADNRQLPESIDIVAPADGFIISRTISPSQHFDRGVEFYRIADLSHVWIEAEITSADSVRIHPGTIAQVTLAGQAKTFSARITNVLPEVDSATRILKLRLECDNPGFVLRPDMFVDVALPTSMPAGLTIPVDAVIDTGEGQRVFVERGSGEFESRAVETGWEAGDRVQVLKGLSEGERVVSEGAFLVDSESRLKSSAQSSTGQTKHGDAPLNTEKKPT
jgi:Cu(I)/Ag(I) efflux system membrane fusion protein